MKANVEFKGLKELQRDIDEAMKDLPPGLQGAMQKATLVVEREAKIRAPVDTGRLRASIASEVRAIGGGVQGIVGSVVEYAPYVELGTKYMRPRPYLGAALEAKMNEILQILEGFVNRIVTKIERG